MSDAAPPDGTDPRVLVPDEDDREVAIVRNDRSSSEAYHTHPDACDKINRETRHRTVKESIAKWQGKHLCGRCEEIDARPGPLADVEPAARGPRGIICAEACARLRKLVAAGHDPAAVGRALGITKSSVYRHLRGDVGHDVSHPGLTYTEAGTWEVRDA